jgi:hypothetical protein
MGVLLLTCGLVLAGVGTWRGYRSARDAIAPAAHPGDPTRVTIDASRPPHPSSAARRFARSAAVAIGWLVLALYGLFLASTGSVVGGLG